ncbi:hypothetical protein E2562_037595 [Oryza meyeriana var. granulata]|uniref:Uncharacterized protein n=1 Tax=Oryza meyeriana var. granulata TaxID=110450 RepID=A0A6G1E802_9ORYZ|nr:hypothetical protein E2562_037595 [Oryza meyeriana var. granulata]
MLPSLHARHDSNSNGHRGGGLPRAPPPPGDEADGKEIGYDVEHKLSTTARRAPRLQNASNSRLREFWVWPEGRTFDDAGCGPDPGLAGDLERILRSGRGPTSQRATYQPSAKAAPDWTRGTHTASTCVAAYKVCWAGWWS